MPTRIFVNTRPRWHQSTPDAPSDRATLDRMREIVVADFVRLGQRIEVVAIAYREGEAVTTALAGRERHCDSCVCVQITANSPAE